MMKSSKKQNGSRRKDKMIEKDKLSIKKDGELIVRQSNQRDQKRRGTKKLVQKREWQLFSKSDCETR